MNNEVLKCHFCGSTHIRVPLLSVAFGMGGDDFAFCEECLKGMNTDEFMEQFFTSNGYAYPPKLASWAQEAVDQSMHPSEVIYGWGHGGDIPKTRSQGTKRKIDSISKERNKMTNSFRYNIMRRDNFHCILCGRTGRDDTLVVDHIHPIAKGGKTEEQNLRTLCQTCNSGKAAKIEEND